MDSLSVLELELDDEIPRLDVDLLTVELEELWK